MEKFFFDIDEEYKDIPIYVLTGRQTVANFLSKKMLYEKGTVDLLADFLKKNNDFIFLDIGAHIGYYSVICAAINKSVEIHSFEPHPESFKVLERNLGDNKQCHLHNIAIFDQNEQYELSKIFDPACSSLGNPASDSPDISAGLAFSVEAKTLNDCGLDLSRVKLIKIDIEGHEERALYPVIDKLTSGTVIFCEVCKNKGRLEEFFKEHNFDLKASCGLNKMFIKR